MNRRIASVILLIVVTLCTTSCSFIWKGEWKKVEEANTLFNSDRPERFIEALAKLSEVETTKFIVDDTNFMLDNSKLLQEIYRLRKVYRAAWEEETKKYLLDQYKDTRLVFIEEFTLHISNLDGSGKIQLLDDYSYGNHLTPRWSPDGEYIVFTARERDKGLFNDIFLIKRDGTGLRQLTDEKYDCQSPSWSPDGRKIAYHNKYAEIFVIDLDKDTHTKVYPNDTIPEDEIYPAFYPVFLKDNKTILFMRDDKIITVEGKTQTVYPIENFAEHSLLFIYEDLKISKNGESVYFMNSQGVYRLELSSRKVYEVFATGYFSFSTDENFFVFQGDSSEPEVVITPNKMKGLYTLVHFGTGRMIDWSPPKDSWE